MKIVFYSPIYSNLIAIKNPDLLKEKSGIVSGFLFIFRYIRFSCGNWGNVVEKIMWRCACWLSPCLPLRYYLFLLVSSGGWKWYNFLLSPTSDVKFQPRLSHFHTFKGEYIRVLLKIELSLYQVNSTTLFLYKRFPIGIHLNLKSFKIRTLVNLINLANRQKFSLHV